MNVWKNKILAILIVIAIIFAHPELLFAVGSSGFENASYSARSLGQGNAVVARPQDPDTVAFNPAGIPELEGTQVGGNVEGIHVVTWHKSAVTHNTEKSANLLTFVPTGYVTHNLGERFDNRIGVGTGFNFPFGLSNRYPSHAEMARYAGFRNDIKLAALHFAAGAKVHEKLNLGASAINYRIYQYDQIFAYPNGAVLNPADPTAFHDGQANTYQHGNAWGWTASALLKPIEKHTIGVQYRSRVNIETNGRAVITGLQGIAGVGSACDLQGFDTCPYWESGIHSDVQLPQQITVGYAYIPSPKWSAEVDVAWTGWSVFADQDISVDRPNAVTQALGRIPRNFHNTLSLNFGGHYKPGQKIDWLWGGWMYSAASPKENFDSVIPDSNRFAVSGGFTYPLTKKLDVTTIAFVNLWEKRSIENREHFAKNRVSNDGQYITFVYAVMTGFKYKFGAGEEEKPKVEETVQTASPIIRQFPKNLA